jgi:hypothetical protein
MYEYEIPVYLSLYVYIIPKDTHIIASNSNIFLYRSELSNIIPISIQLLITNLVFPFDKFKLDHEIREK